MIKLKSLLHQLPEFNQFQKYLLEKDVIYLRGIYGSFLAIVLNYIREISNSSQLVIVSDPTESEKIIDDLNSFSRSDLNAYFPSDEIVPFDKGIFSPALHSKRMYALLLAIEKVAPIIITTPSGLLKRVPAPYLLEKNTVHLTVSENFERDLLLDWLIETGYQRVDTIDEIGQFSIRGGIVDVFSIDSDVPYRLEFFGDTIESIREFDILSQLSTQQLNNIRLLGKPGDSEENASLLDYFPKNTILFWDDYFRARQQLRDWWEESVKIFSEKKDELPFKDLDEHYILPDHIEKKITNFKQIKLTHFTSEDEEDINFRVNPPAYFKGNMKLFVEHIQKYFYPGKKVNLKRMFLLHDGKSSRERLEEILEAEMGALPPVQLIDGGLHHGFFLPEYNIEVLTDHEIFNRLRLKRRKKRIRISGGLIRNLRNLKYGDYVVHIDYGIGRYVGTERIKVAGIDKDVVKLEYEEKDILYVNIDKLNRIQKYISEEGFRPKLTRLGSAEWERVKVRTKKSVEHVARDLVQLYATRLSQKGHAFSSDTLWQKELEASFLFEDTPDQARAAYEIKQDMESSKPMDRLICGDVGFGKTEIAVRAAFKAVVDGKQVAILVPTTILAQQHYNTFSERMSNFPVNLDVISRFRTPKEQKAILAELAEGNIDIIIGTHRLLSDDIVFKDLGLLVVDEEQRFGVKHKEKLKKLKVTVDTITLSATPIPRTLHLSLMGARDLSNVDTPPNNRVPIFTEISTWDSMLIYKAITHEMERGGQIFFVHNRVQTIEVMTNMLKTIVPNARFGIAHGQMNERHLEKVMDDFYHRKFDVLVSTMIIESGLDIPNCNTIIVNRADKFGLAQLYQLRGRVGRSDKQAYAYLIIPPEERLNENSIKRLYAIEEFGDLGSGLKISMRDLEIRGAGNLLGHKQSGFMNAVGYDLYQKILRDTVQSIQEETLPEDFLQQRMPIVDATVDIDAETYLPDDYINSASEKVVIYHRLLNLDNLHLIDNLANELKDRFGPLPEPSENLIEMVKIKKLASQRYIKQVKIRRNEMNICFDPRATEKEFFIEKELPKYINQKIADLKFSQSEELKATITLKGKTDKDQISFAKYFLRNL
jgi:transcription-repair coupling factor (superfamily II helicase)